MSLLQQLFLATISKNSVATDPYFNYVLLLLHLNGTNGSTTFTDSSSNNTTVTSPGGVTISTAQSKFDGGSANFPASANTDRLQCTLSQTINPRTDIFTIESWVYKNTGAIFVLFTMGISGDDFYLTEQGSIVYLGDNVINNISFSASLITANTWVHVAVTFDGTTYRVFVNGSSVGTSTTLLKNVNSSTLLIGTRPSQGPQKYSGYMDEFRITKGVARYTSNFTPPTAPFPNS